MKKLKESVSTRTKVKVIRAIESGIRMQSVAETVGLSLDKVKEIRKRANADIKAVSAFLQDATSDQKRRMAHAVRSSGGNELSSRRESLGLSRQTLRRWILAAETGMLEEYGSVQALVDRIEQYVEYYNERRIQLRLDGMSPAEYRRSRMCASTI